MLTEIEQQLESWNTRHNGDLLPCPFCGGSVLKLCNTHTAKYWVECEDCEAQVGGEVFGENKREQTPAQHRRAMVSAVRAWNRRA